MNERRAGQDPDRLAASRGVPARFQRCLARLLLFCFALGMLSAASGCTTYARRSTQIRDAFYQNQLPLASQKIAEGLKRDGGDDDVLRMEQAIVELAEGRARDAEQTLRGVRDRLDYLEQRSVAEESWSYLTDDQRRAYSGEDYEQVLLRAFLALSNLMYDGGDAEAYSLQMVARQEQIIQQGVDEHGENPKASYPRVALAPYLQGVLRESTHRDYDDAQRSYEAVASWQPDFGPAREDWMRAAGGHHSAAGNGALYVFVLAGRGPYKEETVEVPSSASLLIAGEIVNAVGQQTVPPNVAPVKVPQLIGQPDVVRTVMVNVGNQPVGSTSTVTDVTDLALRQYQAIYPRVVARAVARRCLKKGVVYGAKQVSDVTKGSAVGLAVDLAGVAWEATESADTRCWGLLPDKIQVLRVELPEGQHRVDLMPVSGHGSLGQVSSVQVPITDGRNTYLLANFPGPMLVGQVLVGGP